MRLVLSAFVFVLGIYFFYSGALFAWRVYATTELKNAATPFEQEVLEAEYSILFIGDSTALGTGVLDNRESVAGLFAARSPEVSIKNLGESGLRTQELISKFDELDEGERFDLVVVHIGGNDIIKFTSVESLAEDLPVVLDLAKARADNVVLITSGDVGHAPIFPQPVSWVMSSRSERVLELFDEIAEEAGVLRVDLYADENGRPYEESDTPEGFYAKDMIHPSALGYAAWYEEILKTLEEGGVVIP